MPTTYDIITARGIALIRHSGVITLAETEESFRRFQADPDMRIGQHHLVDCRAVTAYEQDFVRFMALQADILSQFGPTAPEFLLVLLAPPGVPHELAVRISNTWDTSPTVLPRIVQTEAEAMAILGLSETRISDLLAAT